jgi:uncharacterized FlgJ-related protein
MPDIAELISQMQPQNTFVDPSDAPPTDDTPTAEPPPAGDPPPKPDPPDAKSEHEKRMAALQEELSKRDRDVYGREMELKGKEAILAEHHKVKDLAQSDPLKAVRLLGIDLEALAQQIMGGEATDQTKAAVGTRKQEQHLDAISKRIEQLEAQNKELEERDKKRQYDSYLREGQREIKSLLQTDNYPSLEFAIARNPGIVDNIFNQALMASRQTGTLDYEPILQKFESAWQKDLTEMYQNDKIKERVLKIPRSEAAKKAAAEVKASGKSLSNLTGNPANAGEKLVSKELTDQQRLNNAAALLKQTFAASSDDDLDD